MKNIILFKTILIFLLAGNTVYSQNKNPIIKNIIQSSQSNIKVNDTEKIKLPDRSKLQVLSKENYRPIKQYQNIQNENHWYAIEKENDSAYWKNVDCSKLIIELKKGVSISDINISDFLKSNSIASIVHQSKLPDMMNYFVLYLPKGNKEKVVNIAKHAKNNFDILYIEPSPIIQIESCPPNDTYWGNQWGTYLIYADSVWCYFTGGSNNWIAVIDNAVDYNHEDLTDQVWYGYDFADNDNDPIPDDPSQDHGTHVTGTIAATINNSTGIAGILNDTVYFAKVQSAGSSSLSSTGIIDAINNIALIPEVRVINMSFRSKAPSTSQETACINAWNNGKLLIAAAGNDTANYAVYPAGYNSVVSVSSVSPDNSGNLILAYYSNYGSTIDICAPGGDYHYGYQIYSTLPYNNYGDMQGTSQAAPHATGVAGVIFATNPLLTNTQARTILEQNVFDLGSTGWDQYFGNGLICAICAMDDACSYLTISISASGSTSICQGNSVELTAPDYFQYGITYQWYYNGTYISGAISNNYYASQAGVYTLEITTPGNCIATSNAISVSVLQIPSTAATPTGTTTLCQDEANTNYTTTGATDATSYVWSISPPSAGTISGTGTTGTVNWYSSFTSVATISVYGVNSCGNGTTSNSLSVTVNPSPAQPTITANGNQLTSSSATTYQWYLNGSIISGATSQTYTATQDGSYTVLVTNSYGCNNISAVYIYNFPVTQPFKPEVVATAGDYFENGSVALEWTIGECLIETGTGTSNLVTQGFHQDDYEIIVIVTETSDEYQINVYPNPASDNITVEIIKRTDKNLKLKLYDVQGKLLIKEKIKEEEKTKNLNIRNFNRGMYILNFYSDNGELIKSYKIEKVN